VVDGLSGAIIAAGHGVPKPLVEIGGETLLVRQARAIASVGASPVHVIVNSETAGMLHDRRAVHDRSGARDGELAQERGVAEDSEHGQRNSEHLHDRRFAHDRGDVRDRDTADDNERAQGKSELTDERSLVDDRGVARNRGITHNSNSARDRELAEDEGRAQGKSERADDRGFALPPEVKLYVRDTPNSMESLLTLGEHIAPGRFLMTTVDAILSRSELARFAKRAIELTDSRNPDALDGALGVVKWRGDKRPLFATVADGVILALGDGEAPQVTAGLYLFSTRIFELAEEARAAGLDAMRQYLALLIRRGMRFAAIALNDVIDVDEAADLDAARALVSNPGGGS
jgi:NDP-sugar pyrophosphorylase family protein